MAPTKENIQLPSWIWHPERENKRSFVLRKQFILDRETEHLELFFACTGEAEIKLDDVTIGHFAEHPRLSTAFIKSESFPTTLGPGRYTLSFHISCSEPMPIHPINIHLHDRSVGFVAFLRGSGFWLSTNDSWEAGDRKAVAVCVLGEEPFGDLDNAPDWFVTGGYGDIEVSPIHQFERLSVHGLDTDIKSGVLSVKGAAVRPFEFPPSKARDERHIFFHLLKQNEWKENRNLQKAIDLSEVPRILIELPKEYNVRVHFVNRGNTGIQLLWNGAESLEELVHYDSCMTECNQVPAQSCVVTNPQGLRYFQLHVGGEAGETFELDIRFEAAGVPMNQVGRLDADSSLMRQIYDISVHTSLVCHQIGLWDGIKRDRLNWAYDIYMAGKSDYALWDDFIVLRRSIRELGRTPYGYWMNAIPSYTLWWLCGIWDYYLETGDREFVLELKEDLLKHIRWVQENTDPATGFFCPVSRSEHSFIEWSPMREEESWYSLNAIYYMTKKQMNQLAGYIPELGIEWDVDRPDIAEKVFIENSPALLTTLLGIMSGYVGHAEAVEFLTHYQVNDPITPLSAYWLAECLSEFGLHERAWEVISTVWGSMLEVGSTTFWESTVLSHGNDFHHAQSTYTSYNSYRMSLCHSWASTPVVWFSKYVLGIKPLEPGYRTFSYAPNAVGGITKCSGVISSPKGPITVDWRLESGGMIKSVRVGAEQLTGGRS